MADEKGWPTADDPHAPYMIGGSPSTEPPVGEVDCPTAEFVNFKASLAERKFFHPQPREVVKQLQAMMVALSKDQQGELYRWMHESLGLRIY